MQLLLGTFFSVVIVLLIGVIVYQHNLNKPNKVTVCRLVRARDFYRKYVKWYLSPPFDQPPEMMDSPSSDFKWKDLDPADRAILSTSQKELAHWYRRVQTTVELYIHFFALPKRDAESLPAEVLLEVSVGLDFSDESFAQLTGIDREYLAVTWKALFGKFTREEVLTAAENVLVKILDNFVLSDIERLRKLGEILETILQPGDNVEGLLEKVELFKKTNISGLPELNSLAAMLKEHKDKDCLTKAE